ncbi:efflux RND transporter periplasmic adaptor subunit [uncultured Desulfovibrio sp.]|uniref:efflux RND transporter periplasmic adaptor subunit n=1 Tax=uncultured Desulfovibrio sp. TaxID=167968 RepID=UPI0026276F0D|nr:efflux RND transporter periplasmic adaptor subunit [uncultured Desulfovibrio sp.]
MRRKRIMVAAALLAAGVLALLAWQMVLRGDSAPVFYGNVEIRQVDVGFRVGGRIACLLAEEGDSVQAGDLLGRLDEDTLTAQARQAQAQLAREKANLQRLETGYRSEEIAAARAELAAARALADNARQNLQRVEAMRAGNAISQKELDNARGSYRNAAAKQKAAEEQLALVSTGYRDEDISAQRAAVAAAEAQYDLARIALEDAALRAPQAGVVLTRVREAGAIVQAGQSVYTLSLTEPVWLRVYVDEPHLGDIKPGMAVEVLCDALPGRSLPGRVGFISPSAEFTPKNVETAEVRTSLVYRVRVQAEDPDDILRQGMPVRVRLPRATEDQRP